MGVMVLESSRLRDGHIPFFPSKSFIPPRTLNSSFTKTIFAKCPGQCEAAWKKQNNSESCPGMDYSPSLGVSHKRNKTRTSFE